MSLSLNAGEKSWWGFIYKSVCLKLYTNIYMFNTMKSGWVSQPSCLERYMYQSKVCILLSVKLFLTEDQSGWTLPTFSRSGFMYFREDLQVGLAYHMASIWLLTDCVRVLFHSALDIGLLSKGKNIVIFFIGRMLWTQASKNNKYKEVFPRTPFTGWVVDLSVIAFICAKLNQFIW